jgi:hypothetical protein
MKRGIAGESIAFLFDLPSGPPKNGETRARMAQTPMPVQTMLTANGTGTGV